MEAGIYGLLRTVFLLVIFIFVFRVLSLLIMPLMRQFSRSGNQQSNKRKEGEVTIEYNNDDKNSGRSGKIEGEYVDYEEVD